MKELERDFVHTGKNGHGLLCDQRDSTVEVAIAGRNAGSVELVKSFTNNLTLLSRLIVSAYFSQENSQNLK